jgi:hypothetical protein
VLVDCEHFGVTLLTAWTFRRNPLRLPGWWCRKHIFTFPTKLHGVTSQRTVSSVQITEIITIAGKIFAPRSEEVSGGWRALRSQLHDLSLPWLTFCVVFLCPSWGTPGIVRRMTSRLLPSGSYPCSLLIILVLNARPPTAAPLSCGNFFTSRAWRVIWTMLRRRYF